MNLIMTQENQVTTKATTGTKYHWYMYLIVCN